MLNIEQLQNLLITSIALSTITCTIIQKTKKYFKNPKFLPLYNLIVNMVFAILFCFSFTTIVFPETLWVGLFSFLGADSIYKTLEGKLASHRELTEKK